MLGDAAGMITPLCGNGMSMAMHAGKIAFENTRLYLSGHTNRAGMEKQYEMQWQQQFGTRMRVGRAVQYFFGGSWSTSVFLRTMRALPTFSSMVIEQTHGNPFYPAQMKAFLLFISVISFCRLSAQSYPCPAPTGIADYSIRRAEGRESPERRRHERDVFIEFVDHLRSVSALDDFPRVLIRPQAKFQHSLVISTF